MADDRSLRIRLILEAANRFAKPVRDLITGSTKAKEALSATKNELKALKQAERILVAQKSWAAKVASDSAKLEAARDRVDEFRAAIAATDAPTRRMVADFEVAEGRVRKLERALTGSTQGLALQENALRDAGVDLKALGRYEEDLGRDIHAATERLKQQGAEFDRLDARRRRFANGRREFDRMNARAAGLTASGAAAVAAGTGIGLPLVAAATSAGEFESGMTDIGQKADLGRDARTRMGEQVRAVSALVNQLPEEMQRGLDILSGFGMDPRTAQKILRPIGQAATAYKAEIADLSAASFAAIDNLKVPIGEAGRVLDVMAKAGKEGAFEVKDMAASFPELTASMQSLGSTGVDAVGDLAAALQITRKGAGDSASAANNLQNLLSKINSGDTIKNFKKFGIDIPAAMKKAAREGRSPIEEIVRLTQKATGGDQAKLSSLFGDMQVQQALRPLMTNIGEYQRIRKEALSAQGVVGADFADRMGDQAEQMKAAKIAASGLGTSLGQVLAPVTREVAGGLKFMAERTQAFSKAFPNLTRWLAVGAAVMAGLLVVGGALAIGMAGLMAPFAAFTAVSTAMGIGLLPLAGIMLGIVVAIGLLAGAAYLLMTKWSDIVAFFGRLVTTFRTLGANLMQGLVDGITGKLAAVKGAITGAASAAVNWFKEKLGIHSPSRVFMALGGHVMAGFDQGLARGEPAAITRMNNLSKRVTGAIAVGAAVGSVSAAPAAPPAARASTAGSLTIGEMHIHTQPGQNAHEFGRAVRRELEKMMAEQASRTRSSYGDSPDTDSTL